MIIIHPIYLKHPEGDRAASNGAEEEALPPPPPVPADVVPMRAEADPIAKPVKKKIVRVPIARCGLASKGQKISLQTNHFKVNVTNVNGHFFHYSHLDVDQIVMEHYQSFGTPQPSISKFPPFTNYRLMIQDPKRLVCHQSCV